MKVSKRFLTAGIGFILIMVIFTNVFSVVNSQKEKYTTTSFWQNLSGLKQIYLDSQYVNKHPKGWIPDEVVNAYAGGAYVQGVSPILIAPDTPPLGRYLIGLSALLFNNENIITLLSAIGSLIMMYLIGMQVFKKHLLALLPPLFISFEPLFFNQLIYTPLLDIIQLFFLLLGFYFFNLALLTKNKQVFFFILANIFLGCFIATKFYITGITVAAAWIATLFILRRTKDMLLLFATLPIAGIVLLLTYVRVLFDHYPLLKFLGIQKYVFLYHKSQLMYPFSVWALLLFNKWYVWFGSNPIISDAQWRISWPLITFGTFITGILMLVKKIKISLPVIPLLSWVIIYLLFFSAGQITSRYFVILIPVMYIVALYGLVYMFALLSKKTVMLHGIKTMEKAPAKNR